VIEPRTYALFVATALVIIVTPGPDTVLVLSRTLASGRRAGLWAALGTQVGDFTQAMLAGLGVSTLLVRMPPVFAVLKWAGVVYLAWLAVAAWRARPPAPGGAEATSGAGAGATVAGSGPAGWVLQGLANNLTNPKMIPFFVALFQQFLSPAAGHVALQSLALGLTFAVLGMAWLSLFVWSIGWARVRFAHSEAFERGMRRAAAVVFLGLAARLAVERR